MKHEHIYGIHAVEALLTHQPQRVLQLYIAEGRENESLNTLQALAKRQGLAVSRRARKDLDKLTEGGRHQGVVAECRAAEMGDEAALMALLEHAHAAPFILILDGVQDPHNLGACLRSAAAFGVHAVVVPRDRSVGLTPVVRKVASGAAEILPVFAVTNLARTLAALKRHGLWLTGLAGETDNSLYDMDLTGPVGLVLGAEGQGLRRLTREHCDHLVRIPMSGQVESLNVSVATGIALAEAARQRGMT